MMNFPGMAGLMGSSLFSGAIIEYAPKMIKGAMKEYLGLVKFNEMVDWIQQDKNLWDSLPPDMKESFTEFGPKLGPMEWFTAEWVLESGKEANPSIVSLIVSWPEGFAWLERQIEDIKIRIKVRKN